MRTEPVPAQRYASIVDVHVILRRGGKVLLLRRAGETYASGQLCLP
jgi:8-oxo-dGTP diphosphatase